MQLLSAAAIRRCFIADPGKALFSVDYDQIELRIIAALANETPMIEAAKRGESLHKLAAVRLFGIDYLPDQYKLSKNINFTNVFVGGADTAAERYGISIAQARALFQDYAEAFPALARYKRRVTELVLQRALSSFEYKAYKSIRSRMFNFRNDTKEGRSARAALNIELKRLCYGKTGWIETEFGRRILVDAIKPYAGVNYTVQSTARDIMGEGFLKLMDDSELNPTVLLLVHDEALGQDDIDCAEQTVRRYEEVMTTEFLGVPITASGKVYGKSWGHGYRKQE